jgi:2-oxoglutarate dehydrogenase E2 component (dihydrolipoamide succinyltransferase)
MSAITTTESIEIRAPSGQEEGTRSQVLRWLKSVGEPVTEHEPLIELETDKVTVEVASPAAGVLAEILKQEQEEVAPGELLGRIDKREPPQAASARLERGDPGALPPGASRVSEERADRSPPRAYAQQGQHSAMARGAAPPASVASAPVGATTRQLSPAVRRLLAEHSLDPGSVRGTGDGGRITVADVMREISDSAGSGRGVAPPADGLPPPQPHAADTSADARGNERAASHRVPHSPVRKRIAARMVESLLHTAPHVTTVFEADLGEVLAHRQQHREEFAQAGVALTLTAYFAQAAVAAIREVPEANSRWTDTELEIYDTINLGIATAAEAGLVVPVLHAAESLDLLETARRLEDLVRRARDGALAPEDVRGGTFTLSNHGVSGSLLATPIIIPQPQSAILGLGKLEKRAVVVEEAGRDEILIRPRCYATLTLDHRVMDGSRANRFLQVFTERLAGWRR